MQTFFPYLASCIFMPRYLPSAVPIMFTDKAREVALEEVLRQKQKDGKEYRFRVGMQSGGCSGFSYVVKVDDALNDDDQCYRLGDLELVVDRLSLSYLQGALIDYVDGLMEKKFVFQNPNAKGSCGCGWSVDF